MMNVPNYREFYQKALIPMNDFDKEHFCKEFCGDCGDCLKVNHWLIALEGKPLAANSEKYEWNVVVYPAQETGVFWSLRPPFYKSTNPNSLSKAIEESTYIVQNIKQSKLTAKTMKIS
ncbi:MAG TPA: hypothetical protein GX497_12300 [Bacillus bacterium]|nr:hypothetical protein [Bacillus sp. (in: firmicutes)]